MRQPRRSIDAEWIRASKHINNPPNQKSPHPTRITGHWSEMRKQTKNGLPTVRNSIHTKQQTVNTNVNPTKSPRREKQEPKIAQRHCCFYKILSGLDGDQLHTGTGENRDRGSEIGHQSPNPPQSAVLQTTPAPIERHQLPKSTQPTKKRPYLWLHLVSSGATDAGALLRADTGRLALEAGPHAGFAMPCVTASPSRLTVHRRCVAAGCGVWCRHASGAPVSCAWLVCLRLLVWRQCFPGGAGVSGLLVG